MSWLVITVNDLNDYLVGAQTAALRQAALAPGQSDPFARVMQDRCNYIRNRISKRIRISATPLAVPPELKEHACMFVIESMQGRIPALSLTDDQVRRLNRCYRDPEIATTDEFPISDPDDPVEPPVQQGGHGTIVSKSERLASRQRLKGL